jgi:glycosyltransferase involved in cell wall biosynthesis/protein-L-isoaspartate O-methyltransferase
MSSSLPLISTVVLNWNRSYLLAQTLESYVQTVNVPYELWIVDNASTDDSAQVIAGFAQRYPQIQVLSLPENQGGEAYNLVIPKLKGEFIHLSENDKIYLPGWCEKMQEAFASFPKLGQLCLESSVPTDAEVWVTKPVVRRFRKGCLLYESEGNVITSSILRKQLFEQGLSLHNIVRPNSHVRFPDDARLSADVRKLGFWAAYCDHHYVRNIGHEAQEIQANQAYYEENYKAKPAVGLQGLQQRMQVQEKLKKVERKSLMLPEERISPELSVRVVHGVESRFWSMFDNRTPEVEVVDCIASLVRAHKPRAVLETGGWLGHLTVSLARALAANGMGELTTLESGPEAHPYLSEKLKGQGLTQVKLHAVTGVGFYPKEKYDFVVFNGAYASIPFDDEEAEFFHLLSHIQAGATLVFPSYTRETPRLRNLPLKLEQMGVVKGMFIDTARGVYVGRYEPLQTPPEKRFVFCLSAGRSGTAFLTWMLRGAPGLVALHEPEPRYQALTLALQQDPGRALRFITDVKMPWVNALPAQTYVESSHYVQKGFMEAWLKNGVRPDIIVLEREPRKIALSRYKLGVDFFSADDKRPLQDMVHPADNRVIHLPVADWKTLNNYQLCYWYALETQARTQHYQQLLTSQYGAKLLTTSLERLSDQADEAIFELYEWLGVALTEADRKLLRWRQGIRVNERTHAKRSERIDEIATFDMEKLELEVRQRCGLSA